MKESLLMENILVKESIHLKKVEVLLESLMGINYMDSVK